jgi:putative ABC transport system substrate-binding protein
MSYGNDWVTLIAKPGRLYRKDPQGRQPAALPVEQVTKIELVISLKSTKAIGLTAQNTLLVSADE